MPIIISTEVCPFWVNKKGELETFCSVPDDITWNDFFYREAPHPNYIYNIVVDITTNRVLLSCSSTGSVLSMGNETEISIDCNNTLGYDYILHKMGSNYMLLNTYDACYLYPASAFTIPSCTYTETPTDLITIFENLAGVPQYGFNYYDDNMTNDYNNIFTIAVPCTYNGSQSEMFVMRTVDGLNWVNIFTYTEPDEPSYSGTVGNQDKAIGGVHVQRKSNRYYGYKVYTSNYDGTSYTYRGIHPYEFTGYHGQVNLEHAYQASLMAHGSTVIYKTRNDDFWTPDPYYGEDTYVVFTNYGVTFSHHMIPPCLAEWSDNGWCDGTWDSMDYIFTFQYDEDSGTLFAIMTVYEDRDHQKLFKSTDWGLNWQLVSNLHPVEYYDFRFNTEGNEENNQQDGFDKLMQINDGYLIILSTGSSVKEDASDTTWGYVPDGVFQFKLSDIV